MPEVQNLKKPFSVKRQPQVYKNLLFEAVLLVVVVALLINFLVLPKRRSVAEQKTKLADLTEQKNNIDQNNQDLQNLIHKMQGAKKDISLLDEALPLDPRVTTIHVLLDSLIASSGLTLANIAYDANDSVIAAGNKDLLSNPFSVQRQLQNVKLTLSFTGTMPQFLNFLKSLENSARLIDVSSMDIIGNKNNLANFTLSLKTYFYAPAATTSP